MESPAPIAELVRWQTATLVAAAVAALELVALVVLGVSLLAGPAAEKVRAAAAPERARAATPVPDAPKRKAKPLVARLPRSQTEILVLNGNGITGAAGAAAERVRGLGYRVGSVGNAGRSDYARTIVMFRRGYEATATRLARDLKGGVVAPLDGLRPRQLDGAHVVLLLGASS
jgi:hypothetical protein